MRMHQSEGERRDTRGTRARSGDEHAHAPHPSTPTQCVCPPVAHRWRAVANAIAGSDGSWRARFVTGASSAIALERELAQKATWRETTWGCRIILHAPEFPRHLSSASAFTRFLVIAA